VSGFVARKRIGQTIEGDAAMKRMIRSILITVGLATLVVGAGNALAQGDGGTNDGGGRRGGGGGNFDPAQFQQQMMDRVKDRLEMTNDDEWAAVQGLVQKVMDARRATLSGMGFGGRRGGNGGNGGGDNANRGGGRGGFLPPPSPESEDLQKALDAKASPDELKAKLSKLRDARKAKEAALTKAQEDLRKVLTVRQEATAVSMGLLP
jgi:Spy/CpxP family protein refolding chaperone